MRKLLQRILYFFLHKFSDEFASMKNSLREYERGHVFDSVLVDCYAKAVNRKARRAIDRKLFNQGSPFYVGVDGYFKKYLQPKGVRL